jgi:thymidylate synthase (FAD)
MDYEVHKATLLLVPEGVEHDIIFMARVSSPENQKKAEKTNLIRYLIQHKHWSPFEMASMQVEVITTRAIAAQLLRHRSFSFQEFSQRYSDTGKLAPTKLPRLRLQAANNRQASIKVDPDILALKGMLTRIEAHYAEANTLYQELLDKGVARECARAVLPLGTPTRLYMSGTIRSWIHYVELRTQKDTQPEHRMIAEDVRDIMCAEFPTISEALGWRAQGSEECL